MLAISSDINCKTFCCRHMDTSTTDIGLVLKILFPSHHVSCVHTVKLCLKGRMD